MSLCLAEFLLPSTVSHCQRIRRPAPQFGKSGRLECWPFFATSASWPFLKLSSDLAQNYYLI